MAKFIVSASAFAKALGRVTPALINNPVVPILENVLLECRATAHSHELLLTCSDLETVLQARLPVEAREEWHLCVPGKKLLDTLKALPDQPVTCTVELETCAFGLAAARSRYNLAGENAADYPNRPAAGEAKPLRLPANELRTALAGVLPTVGTDELRPNMCGVYFEKAGEALVSMASTDGHRLHQYTFLPDSPTDGFIVPRKAAGFLLPLLEASGNEEIELIASNGFAHLADGRWSSRLIDERFPDYRNVIPLHHPNVAVVDRDEMMAAMRRLDRYTNSAYRAARLEFEPNSVRLAANDLDFANDGNEVVDCAYEGEPLAIGFNCPFVLAQLGVLPAGPVRLQMSQPNRAWLATADSEGNSPKLLTLLMSVSLDVVNL
ncbi:MAG: DNA polymerase III subunit beta [Janthinobacterium lividum]